MAGSVPAAANSVILDPFGSSATSCANSSCDVVGNKADFDIQKASVVITPIWSSLTFYLNYHNSTFAPWVVTRSGGGLNLNAADIFLTVGGSMYAIPVVSRNYTGSKNFDAGSIYKVGNGVTALTSTQALGLRNSSSELNNWSWRQNEVVWAGGNGAGKVVGTGSVSITPYGNGTTDGLYALTLKFASPAAWHLQAGDNIGIQFASATCANDILKGNVQVSLAPEPSSMLLFGTLAGALGFAVVRRRRTQSGTTTAAS